MGSLRQLLRRGDAGLARLELLAEGLCAGPPVADLGTPPLLLVPAPDLLRDHLGELLEGDWLLLAVAAVPQARMRGGHLVDAALAEEPLDELGARVAEDPVGVRELDLDAQAREQARRIARQVLAAPTPLSTGGHRLAGRHAGVVHLDLVQDADRGQVVGGEAEEVHRLGLGQAVRHDVAGPDAHPEPSGGGVDDLPVGPLDPEPVELEAVARDDPAWAESALVAALRREHLRRLGLQQVGSDFVGKVFQVVRVTLAATARLRLEGPALSGGEASQGTASSVIKFPDGQGKAVAIRELQAAAGSGALVLDETVKGYVYFREEWLRKHRMNPEKCSVIGVTGESMEPTLPDGCSILLDHARQRLRDGAIFVVRVGDGIMVKRAERGEGRTWMLASDHEAWEPIPMAADSIVIGEVKWVGREL